MRTEPAAIVSTITAAVTAVLALLVAYGFDVSEDQQNAILGVVAVAAPIVAGLLIRSNVYAPATVERVKVEEFEAGQASVSDPVDPPRMRPSRNVKPSEGIARYTNVGR